MRRRVFGAAIAVTAIAALVAPSARGAGAADHCTSSWPMFGHDAGRSFAQDCSTISPVSVATLRPKWYFPTPDATSASPAIVDGHVYIGDWAGNFYSFATDPAPGLVTPEWTFKVDDTSTVGFGRIVSSAAVVKFGDRSVVVFGGGATLYVLDAADGHEVASVCVDPRALPDDQRCHTPGDEVEIESSPAIVQEADGTTSVVVGLDVHNAENIGRTGIVKFALTATSLTPLWKFDPEAKESYSGPDLLTHNAGDGSSGCAGVWGSPAVDVTRGRVFFGTASCLNDAADTVGEHVWGIDLATGAYAWDYGPHAGATARRDDDFGGALNLLPGDRPLVGAGSKDGWYYALDEQTGALAWKTQVGQPGHISDDFAVGGVLASPAVGTVKGEPAVFVATAISTPNDTPLEDGPDTQLPSVVNDPGRMFSLHAIRASDGAILWRGPLSRAAYGPPTFVNGVVLVPSTFTFQIDAIDADTGLPLAARPLPGPVASAPTAVGDSVYGGVGTATSVGSPLAPLSGVYAFQVIGP